MYTHIHTHTQAHTHTDPYTLTHTHSDTYTLTHTCTHIYTHTGTYTHTFSGLLYINIPYCFYSLSKAAPYSLTGRVKYFPSSVSNVMSNK